MRRHLVLAVALISSLLTTPVFALPAPFLKAPAPFISLTKDSLKSTFTAYETKIQNPQNYSLDQLSKFNINFNTLPNEFRPAIQAAVDVWSQNFKSTIPINVEVLSELNPDKKVLAGASPGSTFSGFSGAPDSRLWYASAMANALAGKDLDPNNPEITIKVNSLNSASLYLGTDGNCPNDKYDLESIIVHEIAHGLGFLSGSELNNNLGILSKPTPYDANVQLPDGRKLIDLPSPSLDLGLALTNNLFWSGTGAIKANNGNMPKLYTPAIYEPHSSISHLDEDSFPRGSIDSVMTPSLANGEVYHSPGPVAVAMLQDMMAPIGQPIGTPQAPQNVKAVVSDRSAIIYFDPPFNAISTQVTSYKISVSPGSQSREVKEGPVVFKDLKNGVSYTFSVTAINSIGASTAATSNAVTPQGVWQATVIDPEADAQFITSGIFQNRPIILYSDSNMGQLKLATLNNNKWQIQVVDGDSVSGGRTTNNVAGNISFCTGKVGGKEILDVFYSDLDNKDLRNAEFNGIKWSYNVVDGNADTVQDYREPNRVRTASDVSVSSACVRTSYGLQVFYRDQTQGILLGAEKSKNSWSYELVDGDSNINGKTTGDVAFHLKAVNIGDKVFLGYDSVLTNNSENKPIRGELRVASRSTADPMDWQYRTVQGFDGVTAVAGYDISLLPQGKRVYGAWLSASGFSIPNPDQVVWGLVDSASNLTSLSTNYYGAPTAPISLSDKYVLFECGYRLCAVNRANQNISLITSRKFDTTVRSTWITLNKNRYAIIGSGGKLTLFREP